MSHSTAIVGEIHFTTVVDYLGAKLIKVDIMDVFYLNQINLLMWRKVYIKIVEPNLPQNSFSLCLGHYRYFFEIVGLTFFYIEALMILILMFFCLRAQSCY